MTIDFKKLRNFVKVVDAGSMSRASSLLRTAQPSLSQQISVLETHFRQKLLIRSNTGIAPTAAGRELYRHAQALLRQLEQAQQDVAKTGDALAGHVSIGLATYGASSTLSLPLLKQIKASHPGLVVHINDNFGHVLSELIMNGRMDMAIIYGADPIKGVVLEPLFREELFLVSPPGIAPVAGDSSMPVAALQGISLLLPGRSHFLRRVIDTGLVRAKVAPTIFAEIESVATLSAAVREGLGSTILPWSAAQAIVGASGCVVRTLSKPTLEATISLCISDHLPLSEPAMAVRSVLMSVVGSLIAGGQPGISSVRVQPTFQPAGSA
jgi:LysR family transcriptional regulator, nitrogen assimilation regulatory protein